MHNHCRDLYNLLKEEELKRAYSRKKPGTEEKVANFINELWNQVAQQQLIDQLIYGQSSVTTWWDETPITPEQLSEAGGLELISNPLIPETKRYIVSSSTWDFPVAKTQADILPAGTKVQTIFGYGYYSGDSNKCKGCGKELLAVDKVDDEDDTGLCVNCFYDKHVKPNHWHGPKCECGAKKAGDKYHSRWCPVYEDPFAPKVSK